jgi:hypothetical protein
MTQRDCREKRSVMETSLPMTARAVRQGGAARFRMHHNYYRIPEPCSAVERHPAGSNLNPTGGVQKRRFDSSPSLKRPRSRK